jgi:histidyl-tRNA synthetase
MYTFLHRGKESLTLRPEGTAPVARSFVEHGMSSDAQPVKLFYINPTFRAENPQKGRYRQFTQFGVEGLGARSPSMDAEIICLGEDAFKAFGIDGIALSINSVGCPRCRPAYYEALSQFLAGVMDGLCGDCRSRAAKNPMRTLDCKNERCQELLAGAPVMLEYLCSDCQDHFGGLKSYLDASSVAYAVDARIVRGLDYYTRTAFEFRSDRLGAQAAVCAGGRYDGLIELLGGPPTPGVGFGLGIERMLLLSEGPAPSSAADLYIAPLTPEARLASFAAARRARAMGKSVETDSMERSLKAQMKYADKIGAAFVAIIGEGEMARGELLVRDMKTKEQFCVKADEMEKIWEHKTT